MNKEDVESKTSQLAQTRRSNENLRRQVTELRLEKDALALELASVRNRTESMETERATLSLG